MWLPSSAGFAMVLRINKTLWFIYQFIDVRKQIKLRLSNYLYSRFWFIVPAVHLSTICLHYIDVMTNFEEIKYYSRKKHNIVLLLINRYHSKEMAFFIETVSMRMRKPKQCLIVSGRNFFLPRFRAREI